jgi:hypothetical protein
VRRYQLCRAQSNYRFRINLLKPESVLDEVGASGVSWFAKCESNGLPVLGTCCRAVELRSFPFALSASTSSRLRRIVMGETIRAEARS